MSYTIVHYIQIVYFAPDIYSGLIAPPSPEHGQPLFPRQNTTGSIHIEHDIKNDIAYAKVYDDVISYQDDVISYQYSIIYYVVKSYLYNIVCYIAMSYCILYRIRYCTSTFDIVSHEI